jgi:hypothetical protein
MSPTALSGSRESKTNDSTSIEEFFEQLLYQLLYVPEDLS